MVERLATLEAEQRQHEEDVTEATRRRIDALAQREAAWWDWYRSAKAETEVARAEEMAVRTDQQPHEPPLVQLCPASTSSPAPALLGCPPALSPVLASDLLPRCPLPSIRRQPLHWSC